MRRQARYETTENACHLCTTHRDAGTARRATSTTNKAANYSLPNAETTQQGDERGCYLPGSPRQICTPEAASVDLRSAGTPSALPEAWSPPSPHVQSSAGKLSSPWLRSPRTAKGGCRYRSGLGAD